MAYADLKKALRNMIGVTVRKVQKRFLQMLIAI